MVTRAENREQVLYAHWNVRAFRSVERIADYKKVKARLRRVPDTASGFNAPKGGKRHWRFLSSDKGLTKIIAAGTVVLVLLTSAMLIVALLLPAPPCRSDGG